MANKKFKLTLALAAGIPVGAVVATMWGPPQASPQPYSNPSPVIVDPMVKPVAAPQWVDMGTAKSAKTKPQTGQWVDVKGQFRSPRRFPSAATRLPAPPSLPSLDTTPPAPHVPSYPSAANQQPQVPIIPNSPGGYVSPPAIGMTPPTPAATQSAPNTPRVIRFAPPTETGSPPTPTVVGAPTAPHSVLVSPPTHPTQPSLTLPSPISEFTVPAPGDEPDVQFPLPDDSARDPLPELPHEPAEPKMSVLDESSMAITKVTRQKRRRPERAVEASVGGGPGDNQVYQPAPTAPLRGVAFERLSSMATAHVDKGIALASQGAFYSGRKEFLEALKVVCHGMDEEHGGRQFSDHLAAAIYALEEADHFFAPTGFDTEIDIANLVVGHRTPILKGADVATLHPKKAAQLYFEYATQKLREATGGMPVAADALYGLGRIHKTLHAEPKFVVEPNSTDEQRALAYFQAAVAVHPEHYLAANELGVILARRQHWEAAAEVLSHGFALSRNADIAQNLAHVQEKLNRPDLANETRRVAANIQRAKPANQQGNANFRYVSRREFDSHGNTPAADVVTPPEDTRPAPARHPEHVTSRPWWQFWN